MSPGANESALKLTALSKKTKNRKIKPLLAMNIKLREVDDMIDVKIQFEKPQFMDFFGSVFEYYFMQRLCFVPHENNASDNPLALSGKDDFSLKKINRLNSLSNRQREIFRLLLKGLNNIDISNELDLSVNTVKNHLNEIYLKLGVPNRYVAIAQYHDLFGKVTKISSEK